jgi:hypothetical protein
MTKLKKCKDCNWYIEQVFCNHDGLCEVERIERREPDLLKKTKSNMCVVSGNASLIKKDNYKVSECKGDRQSLMSVALTIF